MFPSRVVELFGYLLGGQLTILLAVYIVFGYGWIPKWLHKSFRDSGLDSE